MFVGLASKYDFNIISKNTWLIHISRGVYRTLSNIYDGSFLENSEGLKAVKDSFSPMIHDFSQFSRVLLKLILQHLYTYANYMAENVNKANFIRVLNWHNFCLDTFDVKCLVVIWCLACSPRKFQLGLVFFSFVLSLSKFISSIFSLADFMPLFSIYTSNKHIRKPLAFQSF